MSPRLCARDDSETTRAVPAARSEGSSPVVKAKCPRWLVPNCDSKPSSVRLSGVAMIPALLIKMCSGLPVATCLQAQVVTGQHHTGPGTGERTGGLDAQPRGSASHDRLLTGQVVTGDHFHSRRA